MLGLQSLNCASGLQLNTHLASVRAHSDTDSLLAISCSSSRPACQPVSCTAMTCKEVQVGQVEAQQVL